MIVDSKNIEFGYELIAVLPYAYWLNERGLLDGTVSGHDTDCLYYFSKNHTVRNEKRSFYNTNQCTAPNIHIHKPTLKLDQWTPPPLKQRYFTKHNDRLVIVCNRHNIEWNKEPINFFSIDDLTKIFNTLQDFEIVYINIDGKKEYYDNAEPISLNEYDYIRNNFKNVTIIHDIQTTKTFNELQLELFASCSKFITMNGGHSILASYFGGENIIYSKYGTTQSKELHSHINSFYRWYHLFGKSRIQHVESINNLIHTIKNYWTKDIDPINILIRTSNRPDTFQRCIDSIKEQTYSNVRVLISYDDEIADRYIQGLKYQQIRVHKDKVHDIQKKDGYGAKFFPNLYFNELHKYCTKGFVLYLDDDDILCDKDVLQKIMDKTKEGNDIVYWKVKVGNKIVPSQTESIQPCDISGIGVCFHHTLKQNWEGYRLGDYRVIKKMFEISKKNGFIDEVLTRTQKGLNFGVVRGQKVYLENGLINTTKEMREKVWITKKNGDKKLVSKNVAEVLKKKGLLQEDTKKVKIISKKVPYKKIGEVYDLVESYADLLVEKKYATFDLDFEVVEKELKTKDITKEYKKVK